MHPLSFTGWANFFLSPKATVPFIPVAIIVNFSGMQINLNHLWLLPSLPLPSAAKSHQFSLQESSHPPTSLPSLVLVRPSFALAQTGHRVSLIEFS